MDKRILWSIIVALSLAVVWLASRRNSPAAMEQAQTGSTAVGTSEASGAAGPAANPSADARGESGAASSVPSTGAGAAPPTADAGPMPTSSAVLPIDVSPGFEYLTTPVAETNGLWPALRRHQQIQGETRDDGWAPRMEEALRTGIQNYLTANKYDTQRIELPVVECRTTGCEIQAVGYREDLGKSVADLQVIVPTLLKGDLGNELDDFAALHRSRNDGRVLILVHLSRKTR